MFFMTTDFKKYCKSCKDFQLRNPENVRIKLSTKAVRRPEIPFEVINMDAIGPVDPLSNCSHKYFMRYYAIFYALSINMR